MNRLLPAASAALLLAGAAARAQSPADSLARLPGAAVERDGTPLLDTALVARLAPGERAAWERYQASSRRDRERDRALIAAELRAAGQARMTRAPFVRQSFELTREMDDAWFRGDSERRMAEVILSFQTPSGGWSKHVDMRGEPRRPGQSFFSESEAWQYIATIDNNSTTDELRFLSRLARVRPGARYAEAFQRGIDYLLRAQFPSGCAYMFDPSVPSTAAVGLGCRPFG